MRLEPQSTCCALRLLNPADGLDMVLTLLNWTETLAALSMALGSPWQQWT